MAASSMASPSTVADRSSSTKSPSAAGRSTPVRVPNRARRFSSCSSTSASSTSTSSTVTAMSSRSGSVISGRTSTSAVNARCVAVRDLGDLDVRRPIGLTSSARVTASEYLAGIAALTTSSSTTPRPSRASRIRAGTLPGRKPGMRTCRAIFRYAAVEVGLELVERHLDVDASRASGSGARRCSSRGHSSELVQRGRGAAAGRMRAARRRRRRGTPGESRPCPVGPRRGRRDPVAPSPARGRRSTSTQSPHNPPPGTRW